MSIGYYSVKEGLGEPFIEGSTVAEEERRENTSCQQSVKRGLTSQHSRESPGVEGGGCNWRRWGT